MQYCAYTNSSDLPTSMSSTILHARTRASTAKAAGKAARSAPKPHSVAKAAARAAPAPAPRAEEALDGDDEAKHPFLVALGERVRALRARRGITRKALAASADVSERHLANLEYGLGNASILILLQVSQALQCSLAELSGDVTTSSPE